MALALKYAINEKSTIFGQFAWNFGILTHPCGWHFGQVSNKLGKNCGFFISSIF